MVNYSGSFSGSSSLSIANYTGNAAAFSVSCWVNLTSSQTGRIFFGNYNSGPGWAVGVDDFTNNKIKFYLGASTLNSATNLVPGAWSHVVFTWDGTTAKIYLNGN